MSIDKGSRSELEKPAFSPEELLVEETVDATESASAPAPVVSQPGTAEVTHERPAYQQHRSQPPDAEPLTQVDPETRVRLFLQGEMTLAELYALSHDELYEIAEQGQRFLDAERVDDAEKLFDGLTALDPYNADFHAALGAIQQLNGDKEGARREYDRAVQLNEGHVAARTNRAELNIEAGAYAEALEDLRAVAVIDPNGNDAHSSRAAGLTNAVVRLLQNRLEEEKV
jgi:Flp pilus assembly protein TadD